MTKIVVPPQRQDWEPGETEPWAIDVLCAVADIIEPRRILELGAWNGRTAAALKDAVPEADVYSVEVNEKAHSQLLDGKGDLDIEWVLGDAIKFLENTNLTFEFVYVDDNHTLDHVRREIELLADVIPSGGVAFFHDVFGRYSLDEVVEEAGGTLIRLPYTEGAVGAGGLGYIKF